MHDAEHSQKRKSKIKFKAFTTEPFTRSGPKLVQALGYCFFNSSSSKEKKNLNTIFKENTLAKLINIKKNTANDFVKLHKIHVRNRALQAFFCIN